jgi:large subunit ribosomal protein L6
MSRIGKLPIALPAGIEAKVEGTKLIIKNSKETKELETFGRVSVEVKDNSIVFNRVGEDKQSSAYWGTYRALANNMVEGLSKGFTKQLIFNGVGYRAVVKGNVLELNLGFSHLINFEIPEGISITVEKNTITIKGSDKQLVGQVAADIRGYRPPEPYKGKGIRYADEHIIRKAGKTAKK